MAGKPISYILLIVAVFAGVYFIQTIEEAIETAYPGTTDKSLDTDHHLSNARLYIKEHSVDRSLDHLNKAIHSIELIEEIADSVSLVELEYSLADLKKVKREIESGIVEWEHLNHAFILALNSVANAQLRLSEKYLLEGLEKEAGYAMRYASEHIHNALKFANDEEMSDELNAYRHIDSLVHLRLDASQIPEIENTIREINEIK